MFICLCRCIEMTNITGILLLLCVIFSFNLTALSFGQNDTDLLVDLTVDKRQHQRHKTTNPRRSDDKKAKTNSKSEKLEETELAVRRKELSKFHKKLHGSIWDLYKREKNYEIDWDELNDQFTKIMKNLGSGFNLIIYNCTYPTYVSIDGKKQSYLSKELIEKLKNGGEDECSEKTGNIWRLKEDPNYLSTLDVVNQDLSAKLIPFGNLLEIFQHLNICDNFLILSRHPSAYRKSYKKPSECNSKTSSRTTSSAIKVTTKKLTTIKSSTTKSVRFIPRETTKIIVRTQQPNRPRFIYTTNPFLNPRFCPGGG